MSVTKQKQPITVVTFGHPHPVELVTKKPQDVITQKPVILLEESHAHQ